MKRFHWAAAGMLTALLALPTLASAAGDGSADSLRTRGTDLLRRVAPAPTAPVVAPETNRVEDRTAAQPTDSLLQSAGQPISVLSAEGAAIVRELPVELGPVSDIQGLVFRDQNVVTGISQMETQSRIRFEMSHLVYHDIPVEQSN